MKAPAPIALPAIELLCVGTELLRGQVNTHQSHLAKRLQTVGLSLSRESSLPDDEATIASEIAAALRRSDAVLVCGGLGPTFDDITREAAARALKRRLAYKPALYAQIERKYARHNAPMPEQNKRQAFLIEGARALPNPNGSAPGQVLELGTGAGSKTLVLLPGPYSEMAPMFDDHVLGFLKKKYAPRLFARKLTVHMSGLPESVADERLKGISAGNGASLELTILTSAGQVDYHATARADSERAARTAIDDVRRRVYDAVGDHVFGEGEETLESAAGARLKRLGLTLAAAESCTGGLFGARMTNVPGSSEYFVGGVVAYSNELKKRLLGVPETILREKGAVSPECAAAMASGVRRACGADVGVSITGVAGPGGGTPQKPVGLVYVCVAGPGGKTDSRELRIIGPRDAVRARSAAAALSLLLRALGA